MKLFGKASAIESRKNETEYISQALLNFTRAPRNSGVFYPPVGGYWLALRGLSREPFKHFYLDPYWVREDLM